jgi:hypothetical protein
MSFVRGTVRIRAVLDSEPVIAGAWSPFRAIQPRQTSGCPTFGTAKPLLLFTHLRTRY